MIKISCVYHHKTKKGLNMKFIFVFLLALFFSFVSAQDAQSVPQKPADTPKDQAIQIKIHDGRTYCYSPNFTKGFGYLLLSDCAYATPARYDVFQRISWKVNGAWMCLSAPSSITGINGKSTEQWDWLLIEPCSLNDANQRWIVKNNSFYTADGRFKIKDYKWYAFISKNKDDYYDHTLNIDAMKKWINTIATPGNISLRTFIGWVFVGHTPPQFAVYYIQNNQSFKDDVKQLFYNPENGHIAQFDYANGKLYCMTSKQSKRDDWNWIAWELCDDSIPKAKTAQSWEFFSLNDNEGALRDKDGNFLRVTQYGPNWGVPYTAKPEYLEKDTTNSPKSIFVFDKFVDQWDRYVNANLGDSLFYCPAPGDKANTLLTNNGNGINEESKAKARTLRSLPPTFQITEDWIRRFWEISTTAQSGTRPLIGLCGPCLLHSYQIVAELHQNYIRGPIHSGGYFFDTAPNTDAIASFRRRFPILAERLQQTMAFDNRPLRADESYTTRSVRIRYAMALTMFPDFHITTSRHETDERAIRNEIDEMFRSPVGTIWIVSFFIRTPAGLRGHGQPVLRTPGGLSFIPTNTPSFANNYDQYRTYFFNSIFRDTSAVISYMTASGHNTLRGFVSQRFDNYEPAPLNAYLSNNNCTGLGEDRRGNAGLPLSATINQCFSGRCVIQ